MSMLRMRRTLPPQARLALTGAPLAALHPRLLADTGDQSFAQAGAYPLRPVLALLQNLG